MISKNLCKEKNLGEKIVFYVDSVLKTSVEENRAKLYVKIVRNKENLAAKRAWIPKHIKVQQ